MGLDDGTIDGFYILDVLALVAWVPRGVLVKRTSFQNLTGGGVDENIESALLIQSHCHNGSNIVAENAIMFQHFSLASICCFYVMRFRQSEILRLSNRRLL